jgi:hypothetical protein
MRVGDMVASVMTVKNIGTAPIGKLEVVPTWDDNFVTQSPVHVDGMADCTTGTYKPSSYDCGPLAAGASISIGMTALAKVAGNVRVTILSYDVAGDFPHLLDGDPVGISLTVNP